MTTATSFNPRPPCGERRRHIAIASEHAIVSIRAPRAGSDRGQRNRLQDNVLATALREPNESERMKPVSGIPFVL